jgi:hypothetical protein
MLQSNSQIIIIMVITVFYYFLCYLLLNILLLSRCRLLLGNALSLDTLVQKRSTENTTMEPETKAAILPQTVR